MYFGFVVALSFGLCKALTLSSNHLHPANTPDKQQGSSEFFSIVQQFAATVATNVQNKKSNLGASRQAADNMELAGILKKKSDNDNFNLKVPPHFTTPLDLESQNVDTNVGNCSLPDALLNTLLAPTRIVREDASLFWNKKDREDAGSSIENLSVRVINAAYGTTATRFVHQTFCDLGTPSCHFDLCCNVNRETEIAQFEVADWYYHLTECVKFKMWTSECKMSEVKRHGVRSIRKMFTSGVVALGDVPYANLASMFFEHIPDVNVLLTLRDAADWAQARVKTHGNDVSCKRNAGRVYDSILSCCSDDQFAEECLEIDKDRSEAAMAEAFVRHNRYIEGAVPAQRLWMLCPSDAGFNVSVKTAAIASLKGKKPSM